MSNKKNSPIKFDRMIFQIKVRDLERAKKFYEEIFGFTNIWYEGPEVGWTEFELPGESPHLGLNSVEEGEEFEMDSGVFTIQVKNLADTKKYLEENEIETTLEYLIRKRKPVPTSSMLDKLEGQCAPHVLGVEYRVLPGIE